MPALTSNRHLLNLNDSLFTTWILSSPTVLQTRPRLPELRHSCLKSGHLIPSVGRILLDLQGEKGWVTKLARRLL